MGFKSLTLLSLAGAMLVVTAACSSSDDASDAAADGVSCTSTKTATDEASLNAGMTGGAGSCVVVSSAITSANPIVVKAGVQLVGSKTTRGSITVTGGTDAAAITLEEGASINKIDLLSAPGVGIAIRSPNAKITDVTVSNAKTAALAIGCSDAALCAAGTIALTNVTLQKSGYGLWATGAHVVMNGGRVAENGGTSLTGGLGVIMSAGAHLEMTSTVVEKNTSTGILLDGETTTASIKSATVNENLERGIWAQHLAGTIDAPALRIEDTAITKNTIVGMGSIQARGIIIVGGKVTETVAAPVPTDLMKNEMVGDGIALLDGSTDFKMENTTVDLNARAAGVLDHAEVGIIIVGGNVKAPPSGLLFVVQNTPATVQVQIPDGDKTAAPAPIGVSAPKLNVPNF